MKKCLTSLVLFCFLSLTITSCNTQKPADEVEDAKDRVEQKIKDARQKQKAEDPAQQEESEQTE